MRSSPAEPASVIEARTPHGVVRATAPAGPRVPLFTGPASMMYRKSTAAPPMAAKAANALRQRGNHHAATIGDARSSPYLQSAAARPEATPAQRSRQPGRM